TLIFQGDADPFVSVQQAQKLDSTLKLAKVRHELIIVKGAGHGWTGKLQDETNIKMFEFFRSIFLKQK
ncbi:MAG: dienelactone hydrolase family protein, partial [Ginsengibacter sp.]